MLFKKGTQISNFKIDDTWTKIDDELVNTEIGTYLKSYTETQEFKNKLDLYKSQKEISELQEWFDNDYARKEQKFRRLHTLGLKTDDGQSAYDALIELYNEAEEKRARIQFLEVQIGLA